jgi:hypothetical protein
MFVFCSRAIEAGQDASHPFRSVGGFRIVNSHCKGLLPEPAPHCVDIEAGFDQKRADRVPQAVEREAGFHRPLSTTISVAFVASTCEKLDYHGDARRSYGILMCASSYPEGIVLPATTAIEGDSF